MLQPVGPALFVRVVIRPLTRILNPVIVKFAGRRHFPIAAQIHHVGRRSGKAYVTPATAHVHGDVIVIALTFGNQSDWSRNVRAAGGCSIRVNGRDYRATNPQFISREDAGDLINSTFSQRNGQASANSASVSSCACTPCPPARECGPVNPHIRNKPPATYKGRKR